MDRRYFLSAAGAATGGLLGVGRTGRVRAGEPGTAHEAADAEGVRTAGTSLIPVRNGKHRVWIRRVGRSPIKVLLLHGGPGLNHVYLECFEDFLPGAGIEMYHYDQLGCLFSDNPDDPKLWTLRGYLDEVEEVRRALGLERFYLYGHSWGGILTYEYALRYPGRLKGIIVSNMVSSFQAYGKYARALRDELPPGVVKTMKAYEAKGEYDAPEYQRLVFQYFYARHVCRLDPWPAPLPASIKFWNTKIYNQMQGPNEFTVTGSLKDWDVTADLHRIEAPALLMGARYDEMDPREMRRIAALMPNGRAAISARGSHLAMYDDQEWYFRQLIGFLKERA